MMRISLEQATTIIEGAFAKGRELALLPRALVRPSAGSERVRGPKARMPHPQERIQGCAGQSASAAPLRIAAG